MQSGGMRTFVSMAASKHPDVLAQAARGIANFVVKCEDRFSPPACPVNPNLSLS